MSGNSKDLDHAEFLDRITKSLYYTNLPVINYLSFPLIELAAELFTEVKSGHTLKRLNVGEASRISRNACVSPCSLVLALLYIERLKNYNPEYLHQVTPSELFLVSLLIASKFLHDDGEEDEVINKEWAKSGRISVSQINKLERDFLAAIDWMILVENEDFWEKLQQLEKNLAYRKIQKYGWCSYTEMCYLMNPTQLITIAHTIINVSSVCLATYVTGLATLLGSTLITHLIVQSCLPQISLNTKQPMNLQANLTSIDLTDPLINIQSQKSDNILPIFNSSTNDVIMHPCMATETEMISSQHLNSMIWLPNHYNALENDHIKITNCASHQLFVNNANCSFNSMRSTISETKAIQQDFATEKYHPNMNWDELLMMMSKLLMENLKSKQLYYESFSRLALRIYY